MIVAFPLQGDPGPIPVMSYAPLMVDSVKKSMPHAKLVQLSNTSFPQLDGVDEILRVENDGDFVRWGWMACKRLFENYPDSNVLLIGTDMIVRQDVSDVFSMEFDVAASPYPKRTRSDGAYCGDGIFIKPSGFGLIDESLRIYQSDKSIQDGWEGLQTAFLRATKSGKWKVHDLDFDTHNFTPDVPGSDFSKAAIVHYRGMRKKFMAQDHGGKPFMEPILGFETSLNTPAETMIEQAEQNLNRDLPLLAELEEHNGTALIVGGGPSLAESLGRLRFHKDRGGVIFALNATHDWLIERGIVPDFHVLLDARKDNAQFVSKPHKDVTYLIASQCHPDVFEALDGYSVVMWTACFESHEREMEFGRKFPGKPIMMVGGGATVGMKAMYLAYLWGFRKIHMFGMDSSYRGEDNHAYKQTLNDKESRMPIHAAGRDFVCAPWMAKQAMEFQGQYRQLSGLGCLVKVHGDGLIPWIAKQLESANV